MTPGEILHRQEQETEVLKNLLDACFMVVFQFQVDRTSNAMWLAVTRLSDILDGTK